MEEKLTRFTRFHWNPRIILVLEDLFHLNLTCFGSKSVSSIVICGLHAMPLCFFLLNTQKSFFLSTKFYRKNTTVVVLVNKGIIIFKLVIRKQAALSGSDVLWKYALMVFICLAHCFNSSNGNHLNLLAPGQASLFV